MNTPEPESLNLNPRPMLEYTILNPQGPAPLCCLSGGTALHIGERTLVRVLMDPELPQDVAANALRMIADKVERETDTEREDSIGQAKWQIEMRRMGVTMPLPPILAEACGNCSNPREALHALTMLWTHDMKGLTELRQPKEEKEE